MNKQFLNKNQNCKIFEISGKELKTSFTENYKFDLQNCGLSLFTSPCAITYLHTLRIVEGELVKRLNSTCYF